MSIKALSWAFEQPLQGNLKLLLLAIADSYSDEMGAFPRISVLCKKASISERTYKRLIVQLESLGHVKREERFTDIGRRTTNIFTLNMGVGCQSDTVPGLSPYTRDTGVTLLTDNVKVNNGIKGAIPLELPSGISTSKWAEWEQHRIEIKKRLTPSTIKKQITFLAKQPEPDACIEQSITNGWTGLFAIKEKINGRKTSKPRLSAVARVIAAGQDAIDGQPLGQDDGDLWPRLDE